MRFCLCVIYGLVVSLCLPRAAPSARTRQQSTAPVFNFTFYRSTEKITKFSHFEVFFRLYNARKKKIVADNSGSFRWESRIRKTGSKEKCERAIFELKKKFHSTFSFGGDAIGLRKSITLFSLSTIVDCIHRIIYNCVVQTGYYLQLRRTNRLLKKKVRLFYLRQQEIRTIFNENFYWKKKSNEIKTSSQKLTKLTSAIAVCACVLDCVG